MQGWFRVYRDLFDKPIWLDSTPEQKTVLMTIISMANHQEKQWEWQGQPYKVKPGQFVTSLESITKRCGKGVSIQNVRTALKRFEKYGFLTNESTNKNRLITLVNWEFYQSSEEKLTSKTTGNQQATNKQLTTNKNDKEYKEDIYTVFEHWNSKKLITHRNLNEKMKSHINARLEECSIQDLLKSIDNYAEVLTKDFYYWTHRWTLQDFMKPNNVIRFLDSSKPFETFSSNKAKSQQAAKPIVDEEYRQERKVESSFDGSLF